MVEEWKLGMMERGSVGAWLSVEKLYRNFTKFNQKLKKSGS
jgi:hypothetical protein